MKEPKKKRKRFTSLKTAEKFANNVNGTVNDLREIEGAKSNFTVTYLQSPKTLKHGNPFRKDLEMSPENDKDFGYPNEYWK